MTEAEELELLQLEAEAESAQAPQPASARPSPEDLYTQEAEALDNQPYISPEMNAQIEARGFPRPSAPAAPAPAAPSAPQPPQEPGIMGRLTQLGSMVNPVAGVGAALADMATPYLKEAADFYQTEVGAPVVEALYKHDVMSPVFEGTAMEPLRRQMLAPIAGEEWANRTTSPGGEQSLKAAVGGIPGVGGPGALSPSVEATTGFLKGAAQGVLPSIATAGVSGAVGAASKYGPTLTRLIGVAAEGAIGGAVEGLLIKSQDPKSSAAIGMVAGPVLDAGAQAIGKVAGKALDGAKKLIGKGTLTPEPQVIGVITKEAKQRLVNELAAIADEAAPAGPRTAEVPKGAYAEAKAEKALVTDPTPYDRGAALDAPATVANPAELTPSMMVTRVSRDGAPVVSAIELSRGGTPKVADFPIGTSDERWKVFKYMFRHKIPWADVADGVYQDPRFATFLDEMTQHALRDSTLKHPEFAGLKVRAVRNRLLDEGSRGEMHITDGELLRMMNKQRELFGEDPLPIPTENQYRVVSLKKGQDPSLPPDPDLPPGPPPQPLTSTILETPDGKLKIGRDETPTGELTDSSPGSISGGPPGARGPYLSPTRTSPLTAAAEPPKAAPPGPPNGGGPPPPPPAPPPPGPGSIPPIQLEQMQTIIAAMDKMGRQPDLWEKTMRQLVGAHARGPKDAGELILMQRASAVLGESTKDVFNRLRELVPKKQRFGFDKDFARYAAGDKLAADALKTKYPKAWAQVEELGNKLLQERDANHNELRALGFLPDEVAPLIENGVFDKYLARSYLSYVLPPGEWAKYVRKNRMDLVGDAAKYLKDKFPNWPDSEIAAELTRIVQAQDPLDAYQGSILNSKGKSQNALKKRDDIPQPIRALMGEVESGTYKLAVSLGNQRALLANARMWNEIVANPAMFSKVASPDMHPVPLPDSPRHFGPAAGGYVTPHLYEALVNLPKAIESGPQWLRSIIGFTKGNEVALGGAGPWFNAIMGNTFIYSELAGGISPTNPGRMGKYLLKAMKELHSYGKNPTGDNWVMSAKRYGTDASGVGGLEFDPSSNVAEELFGDMLREGTAKTGQDIVAGWSKRIAHTLKKGYGTVGRKYDLVDRTYKLANFMAIVDREGAKGMDIRAAMKHASYRVNQSFPAPDKQGPLPQRISRGMPGLFAKYGTFYMENLRVMGMLPKRMLEEPDLRWRLLRSTMLMGGLWGYNSLNRYMAGITQDEIDKLEARQSDGSKYYKPLTFVAGWRNSKGDPMVWDLTQMVPLGTLLGGHPDDAAFKRILGNLIAGGFDSGVAENEVNGFLARTGLVRPVRQPSDMMPGEDRTLQALQMAWDFGLAPKAPERIYEALRKTEAFGPVGPATDTYTPGEAAAKIAGFPVVPSPGQGSLNATTFEFMAAEKEFQRQLRSVANKPPAQALGFLQQMYRAVAYDSKDAHKEAKLQAIQEAFIKETKRMEERQRILGGTK
jgi:hypothetical protein